MTTSRRQFLGGALSVAALAGLPLAPPLRAQPAAGALITRPIPASGEQLPVIGAGTSGSFEATPGTEKWNQLKQVLEVFFDAGARLIDTSPNYSGADTALGALLAEGGWRERCFLATKIAADSRPAAEAQWQESLRRLRTDRVELLQVHNLRDWQHQLPYARELKAQGKTRYVGVTHYTAAGLAEMERIMRAHKPDFIQINYSPNATEAARTVLPLARDSGIAVIINRAYDDGRLFARVEGRPLPAWAGEVGAASWAQIFLKFALSGPGVTAVIPATSRPDRQRDQLAAGHGRLLTAAQQQDVIRALA